MVEGWPVKKLAAAGALVTASAYLLISGGSVATQRAWVMLSIMLIAVILDRPALTMRNVALAAIVIILLSPSAVVGPGFQMSFAATAALIAAYAALSRRKAQRDWTPAPASHMLIVPGWLIWLFKAALGLAITSLVAGLATGLFSAHHFHRFAGNGLLANMLAMPLVTLVVMPAGLLAMLLMPFGLDQLPLQAMGAGLGGVIAVAHYIDGMGGDVLVGQIPVSCDGCGRSRVHCSGVPAKPVAACRFCFVGAWRVAGLAATGVGPAADPDQRGRPAGRALRSKGPCKQCKTAVCLCFRPMADRAWRT